MSSPATFNMQAFSTVTLNTFIYDEESPAAVNTDYIIDMSIPKGTLFTSAHYQQTSADFSTSGTETFKVWLELNEQNVRDIIIEPSNATISKGGNIASLNPGFTFTSSQAGDLVLQIMAMKIFGHPKAAAAISNDLQFTTDGFMHLNRRIPTFINSTYSYVNGLDYYNSPSSGTSATSADDNYNAWQDLQNLFQNYVKLGRIPEGVDDINQPVEMNFVPGDIFTFPIYLAGELFTDLGYPGGSNNGGTPLPGSIYADTPNAVGIMRGKDTGLGCIGSANKYSGIPNENDSVNGCPVPILLRITITE